MRVWLITVGEPLSVDGPRARLMRTGLLGEVLAQRGHDVTRWDCTFDHARKRQRFARDTSVELRPGYRLRLLHAPGYARNISLRRVLNHWAMARSFAREAKVATPPDVVLCSLPTVELCTKAAEYAHQAKVPLIVDVRDLWPAVFLDVIPNWAKPLMQVLSYPMARSARKALSSAAAITGPTSGYVGWGLAQAGRSAHPLDRDFPMGYTAVPPDDASLSQARGFWKQQGIGGKPEQFVACFIGTLGWVSDFDLAIQTARRLAASRPQVKLVLCGKGDRLEELRRKTSSSCPNLLLPGWMDAAHLWTLMERSSVGLVLFRDIANYRLNVSNKPIEYMAAGLPVVSPAGGALHELLTSRSCGVSFKHGHAEDLVNAMLDLCDHPEKLRAMSANARALFSERFSAEKVYAEMSDYIEGVAREFGRGGVVISEAEVSRSLRSPGQAVIKRTMDMAASAFGLVMLGPLLLGLALLVKLTSPGPVFYRGLRAGRGGLPFRVFKFRSMVIDAENLGGVSTAHGDVRVTWAGRFMRRFKLDELPQLINVLFGDMSLVGPRPEVPRYVEMYRGAELNILTVRPGITDWASIWNADEGAALSGAADPDKAYEELIRPTKLTLQLKYVRERTILTDVKLVIYTLLKIVRKEWIPIELTEYPRLDVCRTRPRDDGFW